MCAIEFPEGHIRHGDITALRVDGMHADSSVLKKCFGFIFCYNEMHSKTMFWFYIFTCAAWLFTFQLIKVKGMVTSHVSIVQ